MSGYDQLAQRYEASDEEAPAAPASESGPLVLSQASAVTEDEAEAAPRALSEPGKRKPRVALMGEFSAGKSTLSNLLIGEGALPVNVTATQLPPVWISHGDDTPFRVDLAGDEHELELSGLKSVKVANTQYVRIFRESKFLELCDLIDMPGISDPNMAAEVWQRVIHNADIVIWCSHATQAWRQSEAAVWSTMPPELYQKSILLLTRMDRILSERDRLRVVKRVEKETNGLFRTVLPVSLIKALEAEGDSDAWAESGAGVLLETLVELVDEVANGPTQRPKSRMRSELVSRSVDTSIGEEVEHEQAKIVMPTRVRPRPLRARPNID